MFTGAQRAESLVRFNRKESNMATPKLTARLRDGLLTALLVAASASAFAADAPAVSAPGPSAAMRARMATIHEQMAACLRSDKSFTECRSQMMQQCQTLLGAGGCSMMGMSGAGMSQGQRMRGPRMSNGAPSSSTAPQ